MTTKKSLDVLDNEEANCSIGCKAGLIFCILSVLPACAQQPAPIGTLQAEVVAVSTAGILDVRTAKGPVYRCHANDDTLVERNHSRIGFDELKVGEVVELTAGRKYGGCSINVVRVSASKLLGPEGPYKLLRPVRSATLDQAFPRGNLLYSGIVLRHTDENLVMCTRNDGEKIFLLREDTRFFDSGLPGDLSKLQPNTRISVRAGRNYENELEVYQVIWGSIGGPGPGTP